MYIDQYMYVYSQICSCGARVLMTEVDPVYIDRGIYTYRILKVDIN